MIDFMLTNAGQQFRANVASIAQSLRVIAQAIKEEREHEQETKQENENEHR